MCGPGLNTGLDKPAMGYFVASGGNCNMDWVLNKIKNYWNEKVETAKQRKQHIKQYVQYISFWQKKYIRKYLHAYTKV